MRWGKSSIAGVRLVALDRGRAGEYEAAKRRPAPDIPNCGRDKMPIVTTHAEERPIEMPALALVVARSRPGHVIGRANGLPWHLKSDLRRFRAITLDHAVIMGRRTFESIGRPLPRRLNLVLSSTASTAPDALPSPVDAAPVGVADLAAAVRLADAFSILEQKRSFFVIGGSRLFEDCIEADLIDCVHLTEINAPDIDGDTHFTLEFSPEDWRATATLDLPAGAGDDFPSVYRALEHLQKTRRMRSKSETMKDWPLDQPHERTSEAIDEYTRTRDEPAA